jgi:hypothetical protein
MSNVKVIIQGCYGLFDPTPGFERLILSKGHKGLWSIQARTDKDLIEFVEKNSKDGLFFGKEDYMYLRVAEVDTSKQWTISEFDGAESIKYIKIKVIDKDLNFVSLK